MGQNIWSVGTITTLTDDDFFYVGQFDVTKPSLKKIRRDYAFSDIYSRIATVSASIPTKTSDLTNDSGFITQHQSLAAYAKLTDLSDYALIANLPTKVSDLTNDSGFLTSHQSLSGYVRTTDLASYALSSSIPTKTSDLTNDSGFLTAHQDLTNYISRSDLDNYSFPTDASLSMSGVAADAAAVGEALDSITISLDTGGVGQPIPITLAEEMEDDSLMYLYLGDETGYQNGYIYCHLNGEWVASINSYGTIELSDEVLDAIAERVAAIESE